MDQQQETLDFGRAEETCDTPPLLLVLDRSDDPLTPLLNQWTYQAMVHELIGIRNNVVEIPAGAGGDKGETAAMSAVLSPVTDEFFREHMLTDYGAMNDAVHGKLEELKRANPHLGRQAAQPGMACLILYIPI